MAFALYVTAYALGMAGANLLLKLVALHSGWQAWLLFLAANISGFICVVVMPFALKLAPANVVYAWALGIGFCLLQIVAAFWFKEPLNPWQWSGIACVGIGIILMQVR
jgi:multidrug transporter EmrE-like cation transporter